jgi:hypothetical protein
MRLFKHVNVLKCFSAKQAITANLATSCDSGNLGTVNFIAVLDVHITEVVQLKCPPSQYMDRSWCSVGCNEQHETNGIVSAKVRCLTDVQAVWMTIDPDSMPGLPSIEAGGQPTSHFFAVYLTALSQNPSGSPLFVPRFHGNLHRAVSSMRRDSLAPPPQSASCDGAFVTTASISRVG